MSLITVTCKCEAEPLRKRIRDLEATLAVAKVALEDAQDRLHHEIRILRHEQYETVKWYEGLLKTRRLFKPEEDQK